MLKLLIINISVIFIEILTIKFQFFKAGKEQDPVDAHTLVHFFA